MPLSFGIALGVLVAAAGAVMFFTTGYKRAAKILLWIGVGIAVMTAITIALAAISPM